MNDIRFDIGSLHAAYASGMSVRAVIETVFQRISEADDPGIFIHLASKAELLAEAEALGGFDPVTKPLWGVPFAVKDNIDVAGMPTTAGCAEYAYLPAKDATVVALSAAGVVPACRTLDCVSVFALTVDDAYSVFRAAAAKDDEDPYSRSIASLGPRPPVLSVGIPAKADREFFGDAAMQAGFETALRTLEQLGCRLVEIPFGNFYATANLLYEGAWVAERYAAIADFMEANEAVMHPVTRTIIGGARKLSAADAFKGLYALQAYKARLAPVIASVDLFCVPTAPTHYTVDVVLADPIVTNSRLGTYTNFVNLLDMCGVAVPTGKRDDGLPMSVTLLAAAGKDALTASLASELQAASGLDLGATDWAMPA
ncbi:MAG: hypothetical protein E5W85_19430, partial [Mesorhizobium sp.]